MIINWKDFLGNDDIILSEIVLGTSVYGDTGIFTPVKMEGNMGDQSKEYRKAASAIVTAALAASAVTPAAAAPFSDVGTSYQEAVDYLTERNFASGISGSFFGTSSPIKRADAAVILAKALQLDVKNAAASGFTDVPARAKGYVNALKAAGVISGKTKTLFGPDQFITRGEFALMIQKAYGLSSTGKSLAFKDVSPLYESAVDALISNGITKGKSGQRFGTQDFLTRGEYAVLLYKADTFKAPVVIQDMTVLTSADGTASITASVIGAAEQEKAVVEIVSEGKAADSQTVTVKKGKVSADFTNLSAGSYTVKITVGKTTAEKSLTVGAKPAVAITNLAASAANGTAVVTGSIANAAADADVKVELYVTGDSTPAASKVVKAGDGNLKVDFTGLSAGTYLVKAAVGAAAGEASFTLSSPSSGGGTSYSDTELLNMGRTYTRNLNIPANGTGIVTYGPASGKSVINGDVTISGNLNGTINLRNIQINGDLTINTPQATVHNSASITGNAIISNVSSSTWNEEADGNNLVFNDPDPDTNLIVKEGHSANRIELNSRTKLTLESGDVQSLLNKAEGTEVTGTGQITSLTGEYEPSLGQGIELGENGLSLPSVIVRNESQLQAALQNGSVKEVNLGGDIVTEKARVELADGETLKSVDGATYTLTLNKASELADGILISGEGVMVQNINVTTTNPSNTDHLIEVQGNEATFKNVHVTSGKKAGVYVENTEKGNMTVNFDGFVTNGNEDAAIGLAAHSSSDTIKIGFSGTNNQFGETVAVYEEKQEGTYEVTNLDGYIRTENGAQSRFEWIKTPE